MAQNEQTTQEHSTLEQQSLGRQRHQSAERPMILRQISSLVYPKIQQRQVIMNVLHPGCVRLPRWSPPVFWRRFEDSFVCLCLVYIYVSVCVYKSVCVYIYILVSLCVYICMPVRLAHRSVQVKPVCMIGCL